MTAPPKFAIIKADEKEEKEAGEKDSAKGWEEKCDGEDPGPKKEFWPARLKKNKNFVI